jgi:TonB family protein
MNFGKGLCHRFGAILLFGLTMLAHGSVSDADLQKQYGGKVLTLRRFYPGKFLHFDAAGQLHFLHFDGADKPDSTVTPGAWTVNGQVRVQTIYLKDGVIHIWGQRLFLFFDPEEKQLRALDSVTKTEPISKLFREKVGDWAAQEGKIEIAVECGVAHPEMSDLTKVMNAVFLAPGETLASWVLVPDFWNSYLSKPNLGPTVRANLLGIALGLEHGRSGVSPPLQTYAPEPSYSDIAHRAKYHATTTLAVVVDPDGSPHHIQILTPAGLGLDEAAVAAVSTWRFDPGKRYGIAIPLLVEVQVSFSLY